MPNFRRYFIPNTITFITCVTHNRQPDLKADEDLEIFWDTLHRVKATHPFTLIAYVILPDHFHWLMQVKDPAGNFSKVLLAIKYNYTMNYKKHHAISMTMHVWQNRYWDHVIRNETDMQNHFEYIHWNPVKHGLVDHPEDWRHSSYPFWFERGDIPDGWGQFGEPENLSAMNFE